MTYFRDFGAVLVRLCVVHLMISGVLMIALPISVVFKEVVTAGVIWKRRVSLLRGCSFQYAISFKFGNLNKEPFNILNS